MPCTPRLVQQQFYTFTEQVSVLETPWESFHFVKHSTGWVSLLKPSHMEVSFFKPPYREGLTCEATQVGFIFKETPYKEVSFVKLSKQRGSLWKPTPGRVLFVNHCLGKGLLLKLSLREGFSFETTPYQGFAFETTSQESSIFRVTSQKSRRRILISEA